ncbi:hypothetical protein PEC301875_05220 [Pectobacterium carotovorum subsp. carotovorum]|nr:hypothetical protein PEC301875_05220 [Pectobacterium carotovorum subsp. carotovorum]
MKKPLTARFSGFFMSGVYLFILVSHSLLFMSIQPIF